jgi:2-polyprenyl-6-hydroxyphenyl methylase/3-demethylubiquinone-9 3-methyltransferase
MADNTLYDTDVDVWWQPESALYLLGTTVNPVRVGYARQKLTADLLIVPQGRRALEVGCGGGLLCEEIALMGFTATGLDPSDQALAIAGEHARQRQLDIRYDRGCGEALPYPDGSFDVVFCCDVLEHVPDPSQVISEISRVLTVGGVFCYDTVNRTVLSWVAAIQVAQRWRQWAFMPQDLHSWEMFITPKELKGYLARHQLEWQEHRGITLEGSLFTALGALRARAGGACGYQELGELLRLKESSDLSVMYMGYAIKT